MFFKKQYWSSGFDKKLWIFWWNINGWRKSVLNIFFPVGGAVQRFEKLGSSLFLMGKMLFQFTRIGFCDDIHTKQRRAKNLIELNGACKKNRFELKSGRQLWKKVFRKSGKHYYLSLRCLVTLEERPSPWKLQCTKLTNGAYFEVCIG